MITLIAWIGIGVVINFILQRSEGNSSKENIVGTGILIGMKSISGGILSNYIFQSGFGSVDMQTFTMLGIAPLLLLLAAKIFRPYLT